MSLNEDKNGTVDDTKCEDGTPTLASAETPQGTKIEGVVPEASDSNAIDEGAVTMLDVLEDEKELEEDARAVLGGADDRNCTYNDGENEGYLKRQALYACVTCSVPNAPNFSPAGICLACSYACHNDHTLVELYTKRRFRCDCGNSKLPTSNPCKLFGKTSLPENEKNEYNQNYRGVYCTCHRPYPDEEDPVEDAMIQCAFCEDWFHRRHLDIGGCAKPPCDDTYSELICHICSRKHHQSFLFAYHGLSVCNVSGQEVLQDGGSPDVSVDENNPSPNASVDLGVRPAEQCDLSTSHSEKTDIVKGEKGKEESCILKTNVQDPSTIKPHALFMLQGWRDQLCLCQECKQIYEENSLDFLLDPEDTVHHYEKKSKTADKGSQYEEGMKALSELDRTKQIEAIHGYNAMKSNLMEYLKKFAENGKVVREEDIQEFFQQMSASKKMRVSIPDTCK